MEVFSWRGKMEKQQKSIRSCNTATTDDRCLHSDGKMVEKDHFPSSKIKMNTFKKTSSG